MSAIAPHAMVLGTPLRLVLLFTILALLPGILISMTAFLRIVLVLGFLRHAMGLQQMPPNQAIVGLALFLTWLVMGPVAQQIYNKSVAPMLSGKVSDTEALAQAAGSLSDFMVQHTRERDLALMLDLAHAPQPDGPEDIPLRVAVPAFVIGELRAAFGIGFLLFIPFLVIDLSVAAMLNALGMIMLPPTAIALPFKVMIFVLADGWALLVGGLVHSFHV